MLRPTKSLQARLAARIAGDTGKPPVLPPLEQSSEPEWEQVATGIDCKLLATDTEQRRGEVRAEIAEGITDATGDSCGVRDDAQAVARRQLHDRAA